MYLICWWTQVISTAWILWIMLQYLFQSLLSFHLSMHVRMPSLQSCLTLCDPMECSLPDCSVHGILQARIPEWAAMHSFRGSSQPKDQTHISCRSCTAGGFFTTEPPGKSKNTGVGCHFLLHCMLSRFSHVWLCVTRWTAAHQAPLFIGFSRQEYQSGLPFPSPKNQIYK